MSNKIKGTLLEDLVAMIHEASGVIVEKRKKLPVLRSETNRKREVGSTSIALPNAAIAPSLS
jgi:hypothetical protein